MAMPRASRNAASAYKVLVVEDNPNDRALYKRILGRSDVAFDIYEAENVREGLAMSSKREVDCVLLDYMLPDADGIDFIRSSQEDGLEMNAAIVMVTGQGNEKTAVEAMKLGAIDYITKNSVMEGFFVQSILNAIERADLKRQVRQYQEELEKSYMALSDFTHTVSHDLKAPLRRIIQYCDILKDEVGDKLGIEGTNYVNRLSVNAGRMQTLVSDLLNYSQTVNAQEDKVDLDFEKIIDEIVEEMKIHIEENNVTIVADGLPVVPAYPVRIRELFQNLIENAIKYRGESDPTISISCKEEPDGYLFSVRDNGRGIEEEYHERVFKEFERLHTQEEIEGSGLGLSICRKVVEAHGGKIWVESQPDHGSTFKFMVSKY